MNRLPSMLSVALGGALLSLAVACDDGGADKKEGAKPAAAAKADKGAEKAKPDAAKGSGPTPVQDALEGDPISAILLSQAWFYKDGKASKPGPARLQIWRERDGKWSATRLEDGDSNVFHKALVWAPGGAAPVSVSAPRPAAIRNGPAPAAAPPRTPRRHRARRVRATRTARRVAGGGRRGRAASQATTRA